MSKKLQYTVAIKKAEQFIDQMPPKKIKKWKKKERQRGKKEIQKATKDS